MIQPHMCAVSAGPSSHRARSSKHNEACCSSNGSSSGSTTTSRSSSRRFSTSGRTTAGWQWQQPGSQPAPAASICAGCRRKEAAAAWRQVYLPTRYQHQQPLHLHALCSWQEAAQARSACNTQQLPTLLLALLVLQVALLMPLACQPSAQSRMHSSWQSCQRRSCWLTSRCVQHLPLSPPHNKQLRRVQLPTACWRAAGSTQPALTHAALRCVALCCAVEHAVHDAVPRRHQ